MTKYTKKVFYGTITVLIFSILAAIFSYLFRMILARNLTLADFGLFFSLVAFVGIFNTFRDLGMSQATFFYVPRFISQNKRNYLKGIITRIIKVQCISSIIILFLLLVFSHFLAVNYFHTGNFIYIILFAFAYFFYSFDLTIQTFFTAFQKQFIFSLQNFLRNFMIFFFTLLAFIFTKSIFVPIVIQILVYLLLVTIFGTIFFKKTFPDYFTQTEKNINFKKLLIFGFSASVYNFGFFIISSTDTLILTYYKTLNEVGLYNSIVPIINLLLYLPFAICVVALPLSSELWIKKKISTLKSTIEMITKYTLIIMIPVVTIVAVYSQITLNILFGEKFIPASSTLTILAIGSLFYGMGYINTTFILGIKGPKLNMYIYIVGAAFNLILNLFFVPKYGIIGAAIATSISYVAIFIISSILLYKNINIKYNYLKYALIIISGFFFLIAVTFFKKILTLPVFLEIIMVIFLSAVIYIFLLFTLRIITFKELKDLKYQILIKEKEK